jgi:hypothetical protein
LNYTTGGRREINTKVDRLTTTLKNEEEATEDGLLTLTSDLDLERCGVLKNLTCSSSTIGLSSNRRFKFQKDRQLFICPDDETLSVAAMCVGDPDRSPAKIHG